MIHELRCPACAAPLPQVEASEPLVCAHCGVVSKRRVGRRSLPVVGALGFLVLGVAGVGAIAIALVGWALLERTAPAAVSVQQAEAPEPVRVREVPPEPAGVTLAKLAGALRESGAVRLREVPELSAFDVVEQLPWAESVARAWSPDARLYTVIASDLRANGSLDLDSDPDADVRFTFDSPARARAAAELAEVSEERLLNGLVIRLGGGEARVSERAIAKRRAAPHVKHRAFAPLAIRPCSQVEVLEAARATDLPKSPRYDLHLGWDTPYGGLSGWLWSVHPTTQRPHDLDLFPTDCTPWTLAEGQVRFAPDPLRD